jgi:hypothetical protein
MLAMYDLIQMNVRTTADVPDRLNGRRGLRQSFDEPSDPLSCHSASIAISFHNTSQVLDDTTHREVGIAISHEKIGDPATCRFRTCHIESRQSHYFLSNITRRIAARLHRKGLIYVSHS